MLKLLEELLAVPAPSGAEGARRAVIEALAAPFADEIRTDALGNLLVHKKGAGKRVLLAAHMDTVGMIATKTEENGFVRFGALGGLDVLDLQNVPVVFENGAAGVLSFESKTEAKDRKLHHCFIDVGEGANVRVGDRASFLGGLRRMGDNRITAPYLDNTLGCAVLLWVLRALESSPYDLYFAFTVQEEVGLRGARTAAFDVAPALALAIDVTDTGDLPESETVMAVALGRGAAVKVMDRSIVCSPAVVRALETVAEREKIATQREILTDGGCDAGAIHQSRGGVVTGGLSIPIRYVHSPCETADLRDCDACAKLLLAALAKGGL